MANPEEEIGIYFKVPGNEVFKIVSVLRAAGGVSEISIHGPASTTLPILEGFEDSSEDLRKPDLFTWLPDQNGNGKVGVVTQEDWRSATQGSKDISSGTLKRIIKTYHRDNWPGSPHAAELRKYLYIENDEAGNEVVIGALTYTMPQLAASMRAERIRVTGVGEKSIDHLEAFCEKLASQYPEALRPV